MLSDEEIKEIEASLLPGKPVWMAVSDALIVVQKRTGWVSDEQVQEVADFLKMSAAEVDSIATFYSMIFRRPVGKHVLLICDSVSCHIMEYKKIHDHLQLRFGVPLGQTTHDNLFTWLPCACQGHCEKAPVITVDGQVFGNVTIEKVDQILKDFGWNDR